MGKSKPPKTEIHSVKRRRVVSFSVKQFVEDDDTVNLQHRLTYLIRSFEELLSEPVWL